ncbi:MAG TPA: DegV family protein [Anaerolineales bacterium]|nr:DegV family protein [Anaerolineales bacterium]
MKILTDSASDMPLEERQRLGIAIAPLFIQFPEGEVNSEDISADDFYNRLEAMRPQIPTTAQPSAGIFAEMYRKLTETGEDVLSVHISSGLSGTIQSARVGAEQVSNSLIHLVDTMTLSGGERFQVLAAALMERAGRSREFILERLDKIRASTELIYTLETLEYLARGGRIGRVQALAGMLLRIKPIINVDKSDGKYSTVGKERTIQRAIETIGDHLVNLYGNTTPMWITVLHGRFAEQADRMAELLQQKLQVGKLEILRISPVLGVHTGPGIVGVAAVPMSLMEGLE